MNKLDKYKVDENAKFVKTLKHADHKAGALVGFDEGFMKAIALDLPVKFAVWQNSQRDENTGLLKLPYLSMSWNTLYKYWIDNIYKP